MNSDKIIWEGSPFEDNKDKYCLVLSNGELVAKIFSPEIVRSNPFTGQKVTYKADWVVLYGDSETENTILRAAILDLLETDHYDVDDDA